MGVALWLGEITAAIPFASYSLNINFSTAIVDKCSSMWVFSRAAGSAAQLAAPPVTNSTDGAVGYGSAAFTGLPSANRLYFRALAKEANGTTQLTPSTGFTALTTSRSRNNTLAVLARGEFRLNTSTGETSNPTLAITGDTTGIFVAIDEVLARPALVVA